MKNRIKKISLKNAILFAGVAFLCLLIISIFIRVKSYEAVPGIVIFGSVTPITSNVSGVIKSFKLAPYDYINVGDVIADFDPRDWDRQEKLLEDELNVITAQWRLTMRDVFLDTKSKNEIEVLALKMRQKQNDLDHMRNNLEQQSLIAEQAGIVLFNGQEDFEGRSVLVGEKLMSLADPKDRTLSLYVPIDKDITLDMTQDVVFKPTKAILGTESARIQQGQSLEKAPIETIDGQKYKIMTARFTQSDASHFDADAHGEVIIYGDDISLFRQLFKAPLTIIETLF